MGHPVLGLARCRSRSGRVPHASGVVPEWVLGTRQAATCARTETRARAPRAGRPTAGARAVAVPCCARGIRRSGFSSTGCAPRWSSTAIFACCAPTRRAEVRIASARRGTARRSRRIAGRRTHRVNLSPGPEDPFECASRHRGTVSGSPICSLSRPRRCWSWRANGDPLQTRRGPACSCSPRRGRCRYSRRNPTSSSR